MKLNKEKDLIKYLLEFIESTDDFEIELSEFEKNIDEKLLNYYSLIIEFLIKSRKIDLKPTANGKNKLIIIQRTELIEELQNLLGQGKLYQIEEREIQKKKTDVNERNKDDLKSKDLVNERLKIRDSDSLFEKFHLVVSIPPSLTNDFEKLKNRYPKLKVYSFGNFLREYLQQAKEEALICNPFIGIQGILFIINELNNFVNKKIKLKILTRNLYDRANFKFSHDEPKKIMGLIKIFELYNSKNILKSVEIKDFGVNFRLYSSGYSFHYEGIHQKMVIIDESFCYIGSAEIRGASIFSNGECGCLFTEMEYVNFYKDFFNIFWNSEQAYTIKFEDLNKFIQKI